jgi:probable HAF family extracellular repeat protein
MLRKFILVPLVAAICAVAVTAFADPKPPEKELPNEELPKKTPLKKDPPRKVQRDQRLPMEFVIHRPQDESFASYAHDLSADGAVIVGKYRDRGRIRAFRWEMSGGEGGEGKGVMKLLPTPPGEDSQSRAFAVSADGSVVVGEIHTDGRVEAFRWEGGAVTRLGHLEESSVYSSARGVSANGSMVVGIAIGEKRKIAPVRWEGGKIERFQTQVGNGHRNEVRDVSADGEVVVGLTRITTGRQAVQWRNGKIWLLGSLPGGRKYSVGTGVSGDGNYVVGFSHAAAGNEAFRWSWKRRKMESLGLLRGATPALATISTNRDGSVVVASSNLPGRQSGFRWEAGEGGGSRTEFEDPRLLRSGFGVSDDGSIMIGQQVNASGRLEAFRWENDVFLPLGHPVTAPDSESKPQTGVTAAPKPAS